MMMMGDEKALELSFSWPTVNIVNGVSNRSVVNIKIPVTPLMILERYRLEIYHIYVLHKILM